MSRPDFEEWNDKVAPVREIACGTAVCSGDSKQHDADDENPRRAKAKEHAPVKLYGGFGVFGIQQGKFPLLRRTGGPVSWAAH